MADSVERADKLFVENVDALYRQGYVKGLEDALQACQAKDDTNWSPHWRNGIATCVLAVQQLLKKVRDEP
jgi:hypothetical protein